MDMEQSVTRYSVATIFRVRAQGLKHRDHSPGRKRTSSPEKNESHGRLSFNKDLKSNSNIVFEWCQSHGTGTHDFLNNESSNTGGDLHMLILFVGAMYVPEKWKAPGALFFLNFQASVTAAFGCGFFGFEPGGFGASFLASLINSIKHPCNTYIYIYTFVYIYIYVCMYVYMCVYMCVYVCLT